MFSEAGFGSSVRSESDNSDPTLPPWLPAEMRRSGLDYRSFGQGLLPSVAQPPLPLHEFLPQFLPPPWPLQSFCPLQACFGSGFFSSAVVWRDVPGLFGVPAA
jgi:hypothetical protein